MKTFLLLFLCFVSTAFAEHGTGYVPNPLTKRVFVEVQPLPDLPASFDYRTVLPLSDVKDQGNAGTCWAFGSTASFEESLRIAGLSQDLLSEQELVSCSNCGSTGGGDFCNSYQVEKGQSLESEFPYSASDERCKKNLSHKWKAVSWGYVANQKDRLTALKTAMLQYGVLAVTVTAGGHMQSYHGGVFDYDNTGGTNHIVALVGWDDAEGVWIMRNSWGQSWGEQGYMRIKYGVSRIAEEATFVQVKP